MPAVVVAEFRSVFSHTVGGPDKTILVSAAQHDPARVRIVPFFLVPVGDDVPALRELGRSVGVEPILVPDRARLDPFVVGHLRREMARRGCHVLHAHDFKTDFLGLFAARGGVRLMATAHGWSRPMSATHRFYNALDRRVLARYPLVLTVSEATADILRRAGAPERRLRVLPNGVDTARWRPADPAAVRPAALPAGRVIAMAARLSPDKDVEGLIAAFEIAAGGRPDLTLVVAGDGPERERIARRAGESPLASRIHLLGHRDDLAELLPHAAVAALSSRAEGMPNSLLEAMATGLPVVATRVGGVAEVARDGEEALLVASGDVAGFADALGRLADDGALAARLGAAARRRIEARYSFGMRLRRLEGIYEAVAAGVDPDGTDPAP